MVRETRHLWVGNLPHTIREERILDHFKRYGKVQSVKILPKKEDDSGGACATVAFIDIKSAAKAHNADNKIEDRTLKTDYYEPPASSTASSAIYIHERDDALVRNPTAPYSTPRTPRYGLPEDRNYERPGHYYNDRESYLRRPLGMGYHDEDNYPGRAKSRDRYSRSNSGTTYTENTERNQNHFRSHNTRQHFEQQRYPVGEQYNDERDPAGTTPRLNRRTNNSAATPVVASVASPTPTRSESRPRRTKRRSPSRTPSGSRSNSGSRSRSRSSSGSRSSSSSSKLRSTSSDSSGRSRSPSKSRSPAASYGSQSNTKGIRLDRPSSAIANPSNTVCYLPSTVNTSAINCTSSNTQGSTPTQGVPLDSLQNNCDKEEKRPLGICVRNLPVRSTDTSLKDGLFHEYKKHGKVTMVKVIGQGTDRYAVVCFKKPEDVDKALEVSKDKLFFGCKIEVTAHEGLDAEDNEFRPLEAELDEFHPKATRTLFIGNLEKDINTAELRKHFEQFGEIIEIDIKKQGSSTSYAFIQYSDIASVVKAMRKLDGENLGANRIKLGFGKSMPTNCVWLDGIVDSVSDKFLARHFSRFGIVAYTAVDREKGHALVFYESVEFAQIAVSEMRGRILQGKKLQVDFASRECQQSFFDKLEMTGQMLPGDGTRPWERRERRGGGGGGAEFEVVRNDDRETRVGFENRAYQRYEGTPRAARGNFRGNQRTGFPGRGRGQNFSGRYEVYHDEFGERRHRYNSRDESGNEATLFDGKIERIKYTDTPDCPTRKRNKLRNSISDQESHHSQSPPRSRHQSRSTSPVSKERKSLKDRLHHRIKSPSSHNSSLVNSPCRDTILDELETNSEYRDSRLKSSDIKMDDLIADLSYTSPRSSSEKEGSEKMLSKSECDSFRSRSSLDAESADESGVNSDQLGQIERKKRLLATSVKGGKDSKTGSEKNKPKNSIKLSKLNCLSEATVEELKSELESVNVQYECAKEKSQNSDCANSEMKYLKKKQVQILHLLDQLHESVNSSDNDCSIDGDRLSRKKHRSSSCIETNTICESDISKSHTKDEYGTKGCKSSVKDPAILAKLKKSDSVDGNCISLSLDSFIFRKHLNPRKDQHSVPLATVNSLQKCRRISVDNETCLPNSHGSSESFLCVPSSIATDIAWKRHGNSLSDVNFSENETDSSITLSHFKIKEENLDDDILNKKSHLSNSHSIDLPKSHLSLRSFSDGLPCHEIKRERDISPLSLPLPKFAASLRSPKSSPSILTSPKSTSAHSPRAGHSPSYSCSKSIRIPDLLHDIPTEKKSKDIVPEEKINGANISLMDSGSLFEPQINDTSESIPSVEPIQSPKCNYDKIKECISSSESEFSPSSSPNRPSIEDRIKALDEKFNAWSGSTRTASSTITDVTPVPDLTPKCTIKRSRFSYLTETRKEPSEIVKSLLAHSTIFDQDSKRLQHIDEKYEPLSIKMDLSPKVKPTFRTKAAAKEFSTPIASTIPNFNQSLLVKSPATVMVAQSIISPPATPQSVTNNILSPVTPSVSQYTQVPPSVFTPCSPHSTSFSISSAVLKNADSLTSPLEKDINDQLLKSPQMFNTMKVKVDPDFLANSAVLATSLKSSPLTCLSETPSHGSIVTSLALKREPASPTEAVTENVCNEISSKVSVKNDVINSLNIPLKKESSILLGTKDHSHYNSIDQDKKEFCDSKDPRLSFGDEVGHWRESGCKEEIKGCADSSAKSYSCSDATENASVPIGKKRVSSIDSNESDSNKSINPGDTSLKLPHESSRDCHEGSWPKQEKLPEPEPKKPKLSKSARDRSLSPPLHQVSKKSDKKEKPLKTEKSKSTTKSVSANNPEKCHQEGKCSNRNDYKDKSKSEHKSSKEEKRSKSRESKDSSNKSETRSKPRERRNSEKDTKNTSSNKSSNKPKKEPSSKNEKSGEKKQSEKKSSRSKSNEFDWSAWMLDDEPVYFSMYDKVKARSSKSQTLKHQTTSDLESVRQKFSKLKQSRAKREEKSKSIDQDSDKDSDSSHHSSESESEAKPTKMRQQRKRKLAIESSSEEDGPHRDVNCHRTKIEKHFQSDSATDSDFEYNVSHRQATNKTRKKKTELLDSDSSDSDSNFPPKSQTGKKKTASNRTKGRIEKSKKIIKSEDDVSDLDMSKNQKSKEKEKSKKIKKEVKVELEVMECDAPKKSDDGKNTKKKTKDSKSESDLSPVQKKFKSEHASKEKSAQTKEKKAADSCSEKVQSSEETEKHKPYSKKRKKSKKMSRNKDKRNSEKNSQDQKQPEESDTKSSLPVLLSPKPSSPLPDKQLSPPCLQAGIMSDNDFKSDFSDFDFENTQNEDMDTSRDMWKHLEAKSDTNSEKSSKNKKESSSKSDTIIHSPEQDSSLPSFFDKLSDITDSETGREITDFVPDNPSETAKPTSFSCRKDKDLSSVSPHKTKHEDQSSSKQESSKYCNTYSSPSKEERRRKKSKKQCKERKKKTKEDAHIEKDDIIDSAPSPKPSIFESVVGDEDSRLSDIRLDEDIAEEARRLEQELLAASEETSTFGDDGPAKREEKLLERRFEEEAAKETRRLEAELLSTGRDSWHMKEKEYDSVPSSGDLCEDKLTNELDSIAGKDENIFAGLELHSSVGESSQNDADVFLSGHSESDPYKIDDKDVTNEIEDQRKIEDDLAVSALLQEMHCGEISAPELTKEADYLDMEAHPDETMNYLLPDDGENSLHIADSSPDGQGNDSQDPKLESDVLSPSSNSEPPPALEISTVEDSIMVKTANDHQASENLKIDSSVNQIQSKASCYEFHEECSLEMCESKPPVIDLPIVQSSVEPLVTPVSPKPELPIIVKKKQNDKPFRVPSKPDAAINDETDDECSSDLTENQLAHFEDITNDTADSKDDDNPPVLLPVESPPNLLPVSNSKDQMEPLDKVAIDDNQCLDRIIGKAPSGSGDNLFDKVTDFDKQIGDIINSITEKQKQTFENDGFQMPETHDMSDLPEHSITDPLGLNSSSGIFEHSKAEQHAESQDFDPAEILKPTEKQVSSTHQSNLSISYADECNNNNNKFELPQISNSCVIEPSILNYSDILNSNCETNVIQTTQKMDNDAVTISITEKSSASNIDQFEENPEMNISDGNHTSSDSFLLELFGPKSEENFKIQTSVSCDTDKNRADVDNHSQEKNEQSETDLSSHAFRLQHEIKPLFEIPEINEQNEATEFNQEIFETPSDPAKESQIPCLLSFSFSENSSKKTEKVDDNADSRLEIGKTSENLSKSDIDTAASFVHVQTESVVDVEPSVNDNKSENFKEENLNIEESLERKVRTADAESVCSDTTDITIPETKVETENNQVTSSEEQVQEDASPVEEIKINIKPKTERPRRGRRPKTRRYMESATQKQEPSSVSKPVNTRITRRGGYRQITERTRRSLRSGTSDLHNESNENKQAAVEEIVLSEPEDSKKEDDIAEVSGMVTALKAENLDAHSVVELKLPDKPVKTEEPRKRRGRRKKNSGDHANQLSDKTDHKSNEHEPPKNFTRSKEARLILSLSEREQNSAKEKNMDVYDFIEEDIEDVKFRSSTSTIDSNKHDKKSFPPEKKEKALEEPKSKLVFEKKEKASDEPKSKSVLDKKDKVIEEIKSKPVLERKEKVVEETKNKPVPEKKEKIFEDTKVKLASNEEKEPVLKEHHAKISLTIRLQKDGPDGAVGKIIKKSEDLNIGEESKRESSKPERNTSSKHDTVETYNGPCKSTRKSTRLMNQAAKSTTYDEVSNEVVKKNSKSSSSNISSHPEPAPTRVTRKLRSSRKSEESLPLPSESLDDVSEDKNKNEPVFFIHDNAVKAVLPEPKKTKKCHATESTSTADTSTASESQKKNVINSLRQYRIHGTKSDSSKESSHSLSTSSSDHEGARKESNSTAEEQYDALHKDRKEPKVLKVELARIAAQDLKKTEKLTETEEDSDSRSSPALALDPATGVFMSLSKSSESSETPNTTNNPEIKSSSNTAHDTPNIAPCKTEKTSTIETRSIATVIQESSKVNPPVESPRPPLLPSLRSRSPAVTLQSSVTSLICDSSSKLPANEKHVERVKKPSKKTCSPALDITNPVISSVPTVSLVPESVSVTSSGNASVTASHLATITSRGVPTTTTGTQLLNEVKKEEVSTPLVSKISHTNGYQQPVQAIVTPVVTQMSAGHSTSLPSNVQTKCSNPVSTSSVLIGRELSAVYNSNIPPTVNEHKAMTSEPSNIPLAKEAHIFSSSPLTPVTVWANSKVSSSRNADAHPRACTIQTSSITPVFTTKSENRSSKVPLITNSTPSYSQQSAFSHSYETHRSNHMADILPNSTHFVQQPHKDYFPISSIQLQSQGVRPPTPTASSISLEIAARLPQTPPPTPTTPVTSASLPIPPSDLHLPHVSSLHIRHPAQSSIMAVPPHPIHSELNAFVLASLYPSPAPINPYSSIHPDMRPQSGPFAFPPNIPAKVLPNNFRQPTESRHQQSVMDTKSDQKSIIVLDSRAEEKIHSVKPGRSKRDDKDMKVISFDREDHDSHHISGREKNSLSHRAQQHFTSVRPSNSSCHTMSLDRATESPSNPYASGQGRGSQMENAQPPIAHQAMPSTVPYHPRDVAAHSASRQITQSAPASDKRVNSDLSKKVIPSHQGSSISPGPGTTPARSPLPNTLSLPPAISPHVYDQQPSRRGNHQMDHYSPHPPNMHRIPSNQTSDGTILQRFPVMWQGLLALKNDQAAVQMHFVFGNPEIARASLPAVRNGETAPIRISQRMRLDQQQLEGVQKKLQQNKEHCILMALPCGKDHSDLVRQSDNLKNGFINYLSSKHAAGIVNAAAPGTTQPAFVIHIFPSCDFIHNNLYRISPELLDLVNDISHLVIIIATV